MRGRFAPSPTGDLHFGSLVSAVASFADARTRGGTWLVRIENVDRGRERPGAAQRQLDALRAFGMESDEPVLVQADREEAYAAVVDALVAAGRAFPCGCTRADLPPSGIYPGTCAQGLPPGRRPRSVRLRVPPGTLGFEDEIQGFCRQDLAAEVGAFVIRRADGYYAYQLAVVVDDGWQRVDRVVRGCDLLDSTPRQLLLQRDLGLPRPAYAHHPVAVDAAGRKLSKAREAAPVESADPVPALLAAWRFLGQRDGAPRAARRSSAAFWRWALPRWRLPAVPPERARPAPGRAPSAPQAIR